MKHYLRQLIIFLTCITPYFLFGQITTTTVATCTDAALNEYYVEITGITGGDGGPYTVAIGAASQASTGTDTLTFGPFSHSGTGNAVQEVITTDGSLNADTVEVVEVLCGYEDNSAFCDCSTGTAASYGGGIMSQAAPGSFVSGGSSGNTQLYVLVREELIVSVNQTGLFLDLVNDTFQVYAINYLDTEAAVIDTYLEEGDSINVVVDGTNGTGDLAGFCYSVCGPATYIVNCAPTCGCWVTDDGGLEGNYNDNASAYAIEICPTNLLVESVRIVFTEWDVAAGDILNIYDGAWDQNNDGRLTSVDGNYASFLLNSHDGGTGVSNSPGGGWVQTTCDNTSGCMTVEFIPNGDNNKGSGWHFGIECMTRDYEFTCPADEIVAGDCNMANGVYTLPDLEVICTEELLGDMAVGASVVGSDIWQIADGVNTVSVDDGTVIEYGVFMLAGGVLSTNFNFSGQTGADTCFQTIGVTASSIVCNDDVFASLDSESCDLLVTPDMILENDCNGGFDDADFEMTIDGLADLRLTEIGVYEVFIHHIPTGTACVTNVHITDMALPECSEVLTDKYIVCTADIYTQFEDITVSNAHTYFQECSDIEEVFIADEETDHCGDGMLWTDEWTNVTYEIMTSVTRSWIVQDEYGNESVLGCSQTVYSVRPLIDSISVNNLAPLGCDEIADPNDPSHDLNVFELPHFAFDTNGDGILSSGENYALDAHVCGYTILWEDTAPQEICGGGTKFIRTWKVYDWCGGEDIVDLGDQIVEIKDRDLPYFTECPSNSETGGIDNPLVYSTPATTCNLEVDLPEPAAGDNCSDVTVNEVAVYELQPAGNYIQIGDNLTLVGDLGVGSYYVEYQAEDACGNRTTVNVGTTNGNCRLYFEIMDEIEPTAICDDELQVTVGGSGSRVYAATIDEGSNDNCGIEIMLVRRTYNSSCEHLEEDSENPGWTAWAPYIDIECCDLGTDVEIELYVADANGNSNICWMSLLIEDKLNPVCDAIDDEELLCNIANELGLGSTTDGQWLSDAAVLAHYDTLFGNPLEYVEDNCEIAEVEQEYYIEQGDCGRRVITRRYRGIDGAGLASSYCEQTINVLYTPDWQVTFPADWVGTCGDGVPAPNLSLQNGECDLTGWDYEDEIFEISGDACYKVRRTYSITNWCQLEVVDFDNPIIIPRIEEDDLGISQTIFGTNYADTSGYFEYVQILKVVDDTAPIVEITSVVDSCLYGDGGEACVEERTFSATATDCIEEATETLIFSWEIWEDGVLAGSGNGSSFDWDVEAYISYEVTFIAADNCGNTGSASQLYDFWDCKAPTPYCLHGVSVEIMQNGTIQIWASDFDQGSYDNCGDSITLHLWHESLAPDYTLPVIGDDGSVVAALPGNLTFDCTQLGPQEIRLYVLDAEGNWNYCETYVIVQDFFDVCEEEDPGVVVIIGDVLTETGEGVEETTISVNRDGTAPLTMETPDNGTFIFTVNAGFDYSIVPSNNLDPVNGVSTIDIVLLTQHLLDITPFTNPYQYIAGDANKSGSLSVYDVVILRQLVLQQIDEFPGNESWRFVDAAYTFTTDDPLTENFPEVINMNNLNTDQTVHFIGIKVGDISGDVVANQLMATEDRTVTSNWEISVPDMTLEAGQEYEIPFKGADINDILGYQFTLNLNTSGLEYLDVEAALTNKEHFGLQKAASGQLLSSWNAPNGNTVSNDKLFVLKVKAKTSGRLADLLDVNSQGVIAEAYSRSNGLMGISLVVEKSEADEFALYQNHPNPFRGGTMISFSMPKSGNAKLRIMDVSGKVIREVEDVYKKGYNEIWVNELPAVGVLYYQLETDNDTAIKKMIVIK